MRYVVKKPTKPHPIVKQIAGFVFEILHRFECEIRNDIKRKLLEIQFLQIFFSYQRPYNKAIKIER